MISFKTNLSKVRKVTHLSVIMVFLFCFLTGYKAFAQAVKPVPPVTKQAHYIFNSRKYLSYQLKNGKLLIETNHGVMQVLFYSPKIAEIKDFKSSPDVPDSSVAIILPPEKGIASLKNTNNNLTFSTDSLQVVINKNPVKVQFVYHGDTLLSEGRGYFQRTDNDGLQFEMSPKEHYYGLEERAVDNLRGKRFELYNQAHYGYEMGTPNLNFSIPMLLSSKKYLLFSTTMKKDMLTLGKPGKIGWNLVLSVG